MIDIPVQQMMLSLAFAADTDLNQPGRTKCADALVAFQAIEQNLSETDWNVVWGPAVYSFLASGKDKERRFDNLVYVANNGADDYVVAIAGTNPDALLDWVLEDFAVHKTVPWTFGKSGAGGNISLATHTGLSVLLQILPCPGLPGADTYLVEFLASVALGKAINVSTTGHSLGGALSPALALALLDRREAWDPSGTATVSPYGFAGATPGDAAFAAYFLSRFPNYVRVWNELDVVPHAWEVTQLRKIPTLYGEEVPDVQLIVDHLVKRVHGDNYTQLGPGFTFRGPGTGSARPHLKDFLREAYTQHIPAYKLWASNAIVEGGGQ